MLRNVWPILLVGLIGLVASDALALDEEERRLLEEIVKTIEEEAEGIEGLVRQGGMDTSKLFDARRRLAMAKLQLATTPEEKVKAWEEIVLNVATLEAAAKKNYELGIGSILELKRARSAHLEAQLGLYRAKKALPPQAIRLP